MWEIRAVENLNGERELYESLLAILLAKGWEPFAVSVNDGTEKIWFRRLRPKGE